MIPLLYILSAVAFYYFAYRSAPYVEENERTHPQAEDAELIYLFPEARGRMAA